MSSDASCTARSSEPFGYHDRVVGRLGETGTVLGTYDDGSVLVKLDREPQNRIRYMPADLRAAEAEGPTDG